MIKIKTEKIVVRGERMRKILEIKGVIGETKDLPQSYDRKPYVCNVAWSDTTFGLYNYPHAVVSFAVGDVMSEEGFQRLLDGIREASRRLYECRQAEKKLKAEWNGEEVIVI